MRIIGIDQSSSATGVSLFVDGKLADYTLIKPKSSKKAESVAVDYAPHLTAITMPEADYGLTLLRISAIVDEIEKILITTSPDVVYFEEIFNASNIAGFRSLARLQGFIAHTCWKLGIRYVIVEENKWINSIATYGRDVKRPERKADIMRRMNDLYGLDINVDDVSDAIAIGTYALKAEKEK